MAREKRPGMGANKVASDAVPIPPITDEEKHSARLVLTGVSITLGAAPVDLLTVFSALDLYTKNTEKEIL